MNVTSLSELSEKGLRDIISSTLYYRGLSLSSQVSCVVELFFGGMLLCLVEQESGIPFPHTSCQSGLNRLIKSKKQVAAIFEVIQLFTDPRLLINNESSH